MSTILECKNLSKKYGRKLALDGINLSLNSGRIIGLLGPNGSGKTSIMYLFLILQSPDNKINSKSGLSNNIQNSLDCLYMPIKLNYR